MKTLFFIFIFILFSSFLYSTVINVPDDQPTIQAGIDVAADTDTVLVQPRTYEEIIDFNGKLITVGSLFLTTQETTYITQTIIDGNSSGSVVRFVNSEDSTTVLCGFTITNGSASLGGGIYLSESSPSLKNITIANNSASYGGGIYFYQSNSSLENITITGNSADHGDGICNASNSYPILINSILWDNSSEEIFVNSGSVTITYSDIEGGWTGTGNIDNDPLFMDSGSGNYYLQSTSPCIDSGDPNPYYNDPDSTIADMGAYYFQQISTLDPPQNVAIEIIGTDVHLIWDAVTEASSYEVYSSDDPYTGYVEDTSGVFAGESWSTSIVNQKKFYYVIAVN